MSIAVSRESSSIEYIVYLAVTLNAVAFFLLATYQTPLWSNTVTFAMMMAISFLVILGIKHYEGGIGEGSLSVIADFDQPLTIYGLIISAVLGVAVMAVGALAHGQSVLYVPRPQIVLPLSLGAFDTGKLGDILYQFTLVAPAEEGMKTAGMYALYLRWRDATWGAPAAIGVSLTLWAAFHTIIASFTLWQVFAALVSGVIFYVGMKLSGSILSPIISHAVFNTAVILSGG